MELRRARLGQRQTGREGLGVQTFSTTLGEAQLAVGVQTRYIGSGGGRLLVTIGVDAGRPTFPRDDDGHGDR